MDAIGIFNNLFKDSTVLNFAMFLIGIISLITGIVFYVKSKKIKKPTYIIRTTELVKDNVQISAKIEISYAGEKVKNLSISKLAFWNDGKEPIKLDDIPSKASIKIKIPEGYEILDFETIHQKKENNFKIHKTDNESKHTTKYILTGA